MNTYFSQHLCLLSLISASAPKYLDKKKLFSRSVIGQNGESGAVNVKMYTNPFIFLFQASSGFVVLALTACAGSTLVNIIDTKI